MGPLFVGYFVTQRPLMPVQPTIKERYNDVGSTH